LKFKDFSCCAGDKVVKQNEYPVMTQEALCIKSNSCDT